MATALLQQIQDILVERYCKTLVRPKWLLLSSPVCHALREECKAYLVNGYVSEYDGVASIVNPATGDHILIDERNLPTISHDQIVALRARYGTFPIWCTASDPALGFIAQIILPASLPDALVV